MNIQVALKWTDLSIKESPVFFRKKPIYNSLKTDFKFKEWTHFSICRNSGPIAFSNFNEITIVSNLGKEIEKFLLFNEEIFSFSWTKDEELIVLTKKYIYYLDIYGQLIEKYLLSESIIQEDIFLFQIYEKTVCILTKHLKLYMFHNKEWKLIQILLIDPEYIHFLDQETILISYQDSFSIISPKINRSHSFSLGPIRKVYGNPFVGVTENNNLLIFNYQKNSLNIQLEDEPIDIVSIGNHIVLLFEIDQSSILMIMNLEGMYKKLIFPYPIKIKEEIDGIRIISEKSIEFLERVSDSTVRIFKIGSKEPGALLFDIYSNIDISKDKIFNLNDFNKLEIATLDCLEASKYEFDEIIQNKLLNASFHGNLFLKKNYFKEVFKKIKCLNRLKEIGYPLTYQQLDYLTFDKMIERLLKRKKFNLALSMTEFLNISKTQVYLEWGYELVISHYEDDEIYNHIITQCPEGFDFYSLASKAYFIGKRKLAIQILNHEQNEMNQIKLLVHMNEIENAIEKATNWNQTEYLYYILFNVKNIKKYPILEELQRKRENLCYSNQNLNLFLEKFKTQNRYFDMKIIQENINLLEDFKEYQSEYESLSDFLYSFLLKNELETFEKLGKKYNVSNKKLAWIKAKAYSFMGKWGKIDIDTIGHEHYLEILIKDKKLELAKKFIIESTILEDKIEYLLKSGLLSDAIEYSFQMKDIESLRYLKSICLQQSDFQKIDDHLQNLN